MNAVMERDEVWRPEAEDIELQEVRGRLGNWVRYRNWSDGGYGPAPYSSVMGTIFLSRNTESRRSPRPPEPDINDGFLVDKTVCNLPERHRNVLMVKWLGWYWSGGLRTYVDDQKKSHLFLGMSRATFYRYINQSEHMLKNLLTRETNRRKKSINSDTMQ